MFEPVSLLEPLKLLLCVFLCLSVAVTVVPQLEHHGSCSSSDQVGNGCGIIQISSKIVTASGLMQTVSNSSGSGCTIVGQGNQLQSLQRCLKALTEYLRCLMLADKHDCSRQPGQQGRVEQLLLTKSNCCHFFYHCLYTGKWMSA